ncbi:hypothetical protein M0R45_020371 [Rubus argutus]|uniref:Uncharacterized protein n=1 Tax=Rubus argutus TaxID=59490 RepID=A0AAW1X868_RUBAR
MDDNGTTVDMEVDMVGGKMVGTVDVVVQKDSSSPCRRSDVVISEDSSTPSRRPEPIMNALQQLLTIKKEEHSTIKIIVRIQLRGAFCIIKNEDPMWHACEVGER